MTFRIPTHPELRALLVAQDGVVSRAQLVDVGLPGSTVAHLTRDWPSPVSGVYVAQVGRDLTFRQLCWAGVLGAGPSARLCRDAAAYLAGLLDEEPEVVHVLTPWSVCQSRRDRRIVFVRERPGIRGPSTRSDLPRTGIDDTVIDLCDRSTAREVLGHLARACQRRLTTAERLLERMRGRRRVKHRGLMKDVLLDVAGGVHSHLEKRWLDQVERAHGLPTLHRQWRVPGTAHPADGAHRPTRTLLELDGAAFHAGEATFRDDAQEARHRHAGYTTFRADWAAVAVRPCETAQQWADLLTSRGWEGALTPCPACRGRAARPG